MTPKEQKVLTQAIQSNRRALSLLDKRIEDLIKSKPSMLDDYDVDDRMPFFYGAVGSDGQLGIPLQKAGPNSPGTTGDNPGYGFVRMHPDTAFVLTRITAAITFFNTSGTTTIPASGVGFRFYDESSSRWITFTNFNNEPQQKTIVPIETFSPYAAYNEGGLLMAAETTFPRSGVVRVEVYMQDVPAQWTNLTNAVRVQVVFGGYKVFGG